MAHSKLTDNETMAATANADGMARQSDDQLVLRRARRRAGLREAFGLLKDSPVIPDGVKYQRKLRAEW